MSDMDQSLLEALGALVGADADTSGGDGDQEPTGDFLDRLRAAEDLVNGVVE